MVDDRRACGAHAALDEDEPMTLNVNESLQGAELWPSARDNPPIEVERRATTLLRIRLPAYREQAV